MVKLRRDLVKLLTLCKLMKNREDAKSEILDSDFKMIEARLQAEDYKNEVFKKLEYQKNKEQKRILEQQRQVPKFIRDSPEIHSKFILNGMK